MKRDMDLIRKLLLVVENSDALRLEASSIEREDPTAVGYHFELLHDAGFLLPRTSVGETSTVMHAATGEVMLVKPQLSWNGCEFLDKVRDDTVWKHVKSKVSVFSSVSISIISAVATDYIKSKLGLGA